MAAGFGYGKRYVLPKPLTQEEEQARVNAMYLPEFYRLATNMLLHAGTYGVAPHYSDGTLTPNAKTLRAVAIRLAAERDDDISRDLKFMTEKDESVLQELKEAAEARQRAIDEDM